jgi:hypothetical protein
MELEKQRLLYEDKLKAARHEKEALQETVWNGVVFFKKKNRKFVLNLSSNRFAPSS